MKQTRLHLRMILALILAVLLAALLSACSGLAGQETPTPQAEPLEDFNPVVTATGEVVPIRWSRLSVSGSGIIDEILVKEDERVEAGQVLMRLSGEYRLQGAIAAASFEVASAQYALDELFKDLELRAAQSSQSMVEARLAIREADRLIRNLSTASSQADIDQAQATVILAQDKLDKAIEDFEPYENKAETNTTRAGLLNKKAQAQQTYDSAVRRLNNLLGTGDELDLAKAQADLALAQAQLAKAGQDYEMYKAGPDPADVKLAQERLENARVQLTTTQSALEDLVLTAPFAGTISELYVRQSEWIAPGQPAFLLADLAQLRVETTDLNELDVAQVAVGDRASVTFDALPDLVVGGEVVRIATKAGESSGVNYTVVIELDEIPPRLRWGMTAFVDIEVE